MLQKPAGDAGKGIKDAYLCVLTGGEEAEPWRPCVEARLQETRQLCAADEFRLADLIFKAQEALMLGQVIDAVAYEMDNLIGPSPVRLRAVRNS